eukprot:GFYU01006019.1.p1 GENE.GFYU01006019.1~~GFYU01006019.1.p1  ORF type:complete len:837 (-),score=296.81 GFYU01006019.1:127-2313(-)
MFRYSLGLTREADAIEKAVKTVLDKGYVTADMARGSTANVSNTTDMATAILNNIPNPPKVRPMTLSEKIFAHHAIGLDKPEVTPGQVVCCKVDWTLASELTWKGMEKTYDQMQRPSIWRNDRFWLAIEHTVDPKINHMPKPKELIAASERFAKEANLGENFNPPNTTIIHTDFYRERAQPGQLIVGADSHSCSTGGLGTVSIGLGAADVVMPLVTGETWFKVPETCQINFVGETPFGIGGKDVMLYTLGKLKRNTVAHERVVEYTGNLKVLSCDSRFAIANMTTEFGGIAGVFEGDELTAAYIAKRSSQHHKNQAVYFRADEGAHYAESYDIPLGSVESMVALYPSPDNVVPVTDVEGKDLDGCFIGACTTGEEDLILGALVLEVGMKMGLTPCMKGTRKVTPGSLGIIAKLKRLGLIDIYEKAGFEVGAPGCSYCLGIAYDKAGEGEVWLSSQNRNFRNRMGKGSIGNLASAATVAASSFDMKIKNPRSFLDAIDKVKYEEMLEKWLVKGEPITIVEPSPTLNSESSNDGIMKNEDLTYSEVITGGVQRFEDHIDTDAIIPAEFMPGKDDQDLGTHCFEYVKPEFRQLVQDGFNIVVAGLGFGSGSSREEAPRALLGCGVKAVIAKSFAFIYARNQPNMALLGITITDEAFYERAGDGATITVDVPRRVVVADGKEFPFQLSIVEERLLAGGGVTNMFNKYKQNLFRVAMATPKADKGGCGDGEMSW